MFFSETLLSLFPGIIMIEWVFVSLRKYNSMRDLPRFILQTYFFFKKKIISALVTCTVAIRYADRSSGTRAAGVCVLAHNPRVYSVMAAGAWGGWFCCVHSQEAEWAECSRSAPSSSVVQFRPTMQCSRSQGVSSHLHAPSLEMSPRHV